MKLKYAKRKFKYFINSSVPKFDFVLLQYIALQFNKEQNLWVNWPKKLFRFGQAALWGQWWTICIHDSLHLRNVLHKLFHIPLHITYFFYCILYYCILSHSVNFRSRFSGSMISIEQKNLNKSLLMLPTFCSCFLEIKLRLSHGLWNLTFCTIYCW